MGGGGWGGSIGVQMEMLHTKFHLNQTIDEDFEIEAGRREGPYIRLQRLRGEAGGAFLKTSNYVLIFDQHSNKDVTSKIS